MIVKHDSPTNSISFRTHLAVIVVKRYITVMEKMLTIHPFVQEEERANPKINVFVMKIGLENYVIFHNVLVFLETIHQYAMVTGIVRIIMYVYVRMDGKVMNVIYQHVLGK